jgi:hypothetical protein
MRSGAAGNELFDSARGANIVLFSNATNAESNSGTMSAFNSNGFTPVYQAADISTNNNGSTYVGWQWKESASAGFDVATATSSALSVVTYNHNLGVAPSMVLSKSRSTVAPWLVYHKSLGNNQYLVLNSTAAAASLTGVFSGTSTQFTITNQDPLADYVSYLFAEVAGYSKFGSYTGNGSSDGTFVYTGFRPRFILMKNATSAGESWLMWDTARNTYNVVGEYLLSNASDAAANYSGLDIVSNGFKLRNTGTGLNGSGSTIIYMAFAEVPTKFALAR